MTYRLFIDDERFPPGNLTEWIIARSLTDVKRVISALGWPAFISFDHDLGENEPSGKEIANWIVTCDQDSHVLAADFDFTVHSMNGPGAQNIEHYLRQYLALRGCFVVLSLKEEDTK